MKPRATGFDLDGTLTESRQPLTPETGMIVASLFPERSRLENLHLFHTSAPQCYRYYDGAVKAEYAHNCTFIEEKEHIMMALTEGIAETESPSRPARYPAPTRLPP